MTGNDKQLTSLPLYVTLALFLLTSAGTVWLYISFQTAETYFRSTLFIKMTTHTSSILTVSDSAQHAATRKLSILLAALGIEVVFAVLLLYQVLLHRKDRLSTHPSTAVGMGQE